MSSTTLAHSRALTTTITHVDTGRTLVLTPEPSRTIISPRGVQGPAGPAGASYEHVQSTPASTWIVNHNLGFHPSVSVRSTGGLELVAEVAHLSVNQAEIRLLTPFTGTARFN